MEGGEQPGVREEEEDTTIFSTNTLQPRSEFLGISNLVHPGSGFSKKHLPSHSAWHCACWWRILLVSSLTKIRRLSFASQHQMSDSPCLFGMIVHHVNGRRSFLAFNTISVLHVFWTHAHRTMSLSGLWRVKRRETCIDTRCVTLPFNH